MSVQVNAIMLGAKDLAASKKFYGDGLGLAVAQDHPSFVSFELGNGATLALYEWDAAAADAGVPATGQGFRGVSFHQFVATTDAVDELLKTAESAGGSIVRPAESAQWGGYYGYFADPDGHLWKVTTSG